eukprot:g5967.t1
MTQGATTPPAPPPAAAAGATKQKIAVDLDEVLGGFVPQLCLFHNHNYGTALTPEDFNTYYFHETWGGSREGADEKVREFFKSEFFLGGGRGIPVVEGASAVLTKHAANFELHIVTSRQDVLQEHTREWVELHYPGLFETLQFGNHFGGGAQRTKAELCRLVGAALIIDDNGRYASECAAEGIQAYLFGDYAWNRSSEPLPKNVTRTVTWDDVDAALEALLESSSSGSGGAVKSADEKHDGQPVAGVSASAAVTAVEVGAAAAATTATATVAATENGDVGVAPPSNVAGEDVVPCAA